MKDIIPALDREKFFFAHLHTRCNAREKNQNNKNLVYVVWPFKYTLSKCRSNCEIARKSGCLPNTASEFYEHKTLDSVHSHTSHPISQFIL